jgi:hypothetical protein
MTNTQPRQKRILPDFSKMTREEEANWWDTHDVAEYWDDFEPVHIDFQLKKPKEENIVVRLQEPIKKQLEAVARRKGLNISSLTRMWIMEKLRTAHE